MVTVRVAGLAIALASAACGDDSGDANLGGSSNEGGTHDAGGSTGDGGSSGGSSGDGGAGDGGFVPGSCGRPGAGNSPLDNPDGYAEATNTFRAADYETSGDDAPFELLDIADLTHEPDGGCGGGGWRLNPKPIPGAEDDDEGLAGWKWWPEAGMPADSTEVLVVSYMLQISEQFATDVATQNFPNDNYGIAKIIDLQMWNEAGSAPEYETRQIIQMLGWRDAEQGLPAGGIYLAHVNGGAGGRYANDEVNAPLNLAEHAGEWIWIAHVFDARAGEEKTVTYYKLEGDSGVTRSLVRPGDLEFNFAGTYGYTSRGWASPTDGYNSALWGYWGDINLPGADGRYVKIDRVRSGNGWIAPPF